MVNKRLVFTVTGMIIFVAVILGYVHFSKISRNEKKVNQQTMSQTQTIQQADTETEKEEVNASGDELENVTAGSEEFFWIMFYILQIKGTFITTYISQILTMGQRNMHCM